MYIQVLRLTDLGVSAEVVRATADEAWDQKSNARWLIDEVDIQSNAVENAAPRAYLVSDDLYMRTPRHGLIADLRIAFQLQLHLPCDTAMWIRARHGDILTTTRRARR
ncbi:MAG: hypothetical protein WKG00_27340 [Polyangiaceae bacterium]